MVVAPIVSATEVEVAVVLATIAPLTATMYELASATAGHETLVLVPAMRQNDGESETLHASTEAVGAAGAVMSTVSERDNETEVPDTSAVNATLAEPSGMVSASDHAPAESALVEAVVVPSVAVIKAPALEVPMNDTDVVAKSAPSDGEVIENDIEELALSELVAELLDEDGAATASSVCCGPPPPPKPGVMGAAVGPGTIDECCVWAGCGAGELDAAGGLGSWEAGESARAGMGFCRGVGAADAASCPPETLSKAAETAAT